MVKSSFFGPASFVKLSPLRLALFFGIVTFLLRLPFLWRYDLFFGSDPGLCYLMPLRILQGDRPFYFYGQTFQGAAEAYVVAILFKLFGPSIPLAAGVSLFQWAAAVGIGVYLLAKAANPFAGMIGGLFASISVPYTLIYVTVPYVGYPGSFLITLLILFQTARLMEKGKLWKNAFLLGLWMGLGLYIGKQCLPAVAAAFLALVFLETPHWQMRRSLRLSGILAVLAGFLLGFSPELIHRTLHPVKMTFPLAEPVMMAHNFWESVKSLFAYFDAHPFSRIPVDIYFYHAIPFKLIRPAGAADALFVVLMAAVLVFSLNRLWVSRKENNSGLFLLTSLVVLNLIAVVLSSESQGNIFNTRRYLHISAVSLSSLTGLFFVFLWRAKSKYLKWIALVFVCAFLARSGWHQYSLLKRPDSLREIRWVVGEMKKAGLNRGLSHFGPNFIIDALTNEEIIFANRDGNQIPQYSSLVEQADKIAVISYRDEPVENEVGFGGNTYRLQGKPFENELLRWAPYLKVKK